MRPSSAHNLMLELDEKNRKIVLKITLQQWMISYPPLFIKSNDLQRQLEKLQIFIRIVFQATHLKYV